MNETVATPYQFHRSVQNLHACQSKLDVVGDYDVLCARLHSNIANTPTGSPHQHIGKCNSLVSPATGPSSAPSSNAYKSKAIANKWYQCVAKCAQIQFDIIGSQRGTDWFADNVCVCVCVFYSEINWKLNTHHTLYWTVDINTTH